jgi:hypothetical protein
MEWGTNQLLGSKSTSMVVGKGLSQLPTLAVIMGRHSNNRGM